MHNLQYHDTCCRESLIFCRSCCGDVSQCAFELPSSAFTGDLVVVDILRYLASDITSLAKAGEFVYTRLDVRLQPACPMPSQTSPGHSALSL